MAYKQACDKIMAIEPFTRICRSSKKIKTDSYQVGFNTLRLLIQQIITDCTQEPEPLAEFARWVIENGWIMELDNMSILNKAEELKLIYEDVLTQEDYDSGHSDTYGPDDVGNSPFYRFTDILAEGKSDADSKD
jgi:hypothetical protein